MWSVCQAKVQENLLPMVCKALGKTVLSCPLYTERKLKPREGLRLRMPCFVYSTALDSTGYLITFFPKKLFQNRIPAHPEGSGFKAFP